MKILVLSLLRLGDIIQQKPLFQALHAKYPHAEIHLLANKQFATAKSILDESVLKFHAFDRDLLQRTMGESSFNLFSSFDILEELISDLNSEKFDLVLNWTHNKLSAFFMGILNVPQKRGLFVREKKIHGLDSPWLKYFNDNFSGNSHSFFHYVELLGNAFELPVKKYAKSLDSEKSHIVYFQCFTSDTKKNWSLAKFQQLKLEIESYDPNLHVKILCASDEVQRIKAYFPAESIIVCDLSEALRLLRHGRALISGDTSVKHLAAEAGTAVVEISLGSSDFQKTSAFSESSHSVQPNVNCYPCRHSQKCSQKSLICEESVTVEEVFEKFKMMLMNASIAIPQSSSMNVGNQLERAIWTSYLNDSPPEFDLEIEQARELLSRTEVLLGHQIDFESCENFNQIFATLKEISAQKLDTGAYFQKLAHVFSDRFASAETAVGALKSALAQSQALLQIRLTLINQSLSKDGGTHAERT